MSGSKNEAGSYAVHGALDLPSVSVDSYNLEIRASQGFLGDRANKSAFWGLVEEGRERLRKIDADPIGDTPTEEISKKALDAFLFEGKGEQAGLVLGAIEDFAGELAAVAARFLEHEAWAGTQRICVGGGMRAGRIGEMTIGRASVMLKTLGQAVELVPINHHPDEAGLIGASQLLPPWTLKGHDALLAVDIGGTNIRVGVVELKVGKSGRLKDACVWKSKLWRHADDSPSRGEAVDRIVEMLTGLIERAFDEDLRLAPLIGIGCPGVIDANGAIARGGQNLPGRSWESDDFNLPRLIGEAIPRIGRQPTHVVMHNDAVVQGLSQAPFMEDVTRWGVLTIGTGLGNARFTNKRAPRS
jgi:hypothetical protein